MKHTEEHYTLYFGKKANYYLDIVDSFESGKTVMFNMYAFLFGVLWMLYRKLYVPFGIVIVLFVVEGFCTEYILSSINASPDVMYNMERIMIIVWASVLGLFGNKIYIKQADRKISKILDLDRSEEETNRKIKRAGGTTWIPHLVLVGLVLIIVFLGREGYLNF